MATISGGGFQAPSPANTFSYSYLPSSNLLSKVTGPSHEVINTYEPTRDILDTKTNQLASTVISRYDYAVNEIGQRTGLTTSGTAFPNLPSWFWGYDTLGQVTTADSSVTSNDRSYQYDTIGNRKKSADSLTLPTSDNYTTNALNQYTARSVGVSPTLNPEYDNDGNATAYPLPVAPTTNSTLAWDAENRLISSTVGSITTTYAYDALSRRICNTTGSASTLYLYDDWNCIAEYIGNTGVMPFLNKTRLWGQDLSGTLQGAGGVGGLLCESHISEPQSPIYYPTYDGNGNVSEYLNSTGQVTAHFEYDPFGNTVVNTGITNLFTYCFSTKVKDLESGLYYYGYRYCDPVTGRWPSRDPFEENSGMNINNFVSNDSVSHFDYLGLCALGESNLDGSQVKTTSAKNSEDPDSGLWGALGKGVTKAAKFLGVSDRTRPSIPDQLDASWGWKASVAYSCCECKNGKNQWVKQDDLTSHGEPYASQYDADLEGQLGLDELERSVSCD